MHNNEDQFERPRTLMIETARLLKGRDLMDIQKATGISFYWLRKFAVGEFKNPSVNRVQCLYEHLSGKPLLQP